MANKQPPKEIDLEHRAAMIAASLKGAEVITDQQAERAAEVIELELHLLALAIQQRNV